MSRQHCDSLLTRYLDIIVWTNAHHMSPVTLPLPLRLTYRREFGGEHQLRVPRRRTPYHLPSSTPLLRPIQSYSDYRDGT